MDEKNLIKKYRELMLSIIPEYSNLQPKDRGSLMDLFITYFCEKLWACQNNDDEKDLLKNVIKNNNLEAEQLLVDLDESIKIVKRNHAMIKKFPEIFKALYTETLRLKKLQY